ncbi:MAG: carboxypeptidase-like regulatory domain-containing protein [Thermodesulfobacteriota bacterium]
MKILRSVLLLFALLVLISSTQGCGNADCVLTGFINCGNGGGANKSKINGTVVGVSGGSPVSGIKVRAERNGQRVASDTTNSDGDFTLRVREGNITLRFETSTFNVVGFFTVTEDSEVFLEVNLAPDDVFVVDWVVLQDPIRCEGSQTFTIEEPDLVDFIINGGSRNCIQAKGDCIIDISVQNIALDDCNEGILAQGSANVDLEALAVPTLTINAESNGIHTKGDSSVTLIGEDIFVTSTQSDGIRAEDTSDVQIQPSGLCTIEGPIQQDPTAMVDTVGCN